jgi:hypothetical protein
MQLDVAGATVIAASIGAVFGGGFMVVNGWLSRRSEERRQIRELAVRAAIEEWKSNVQLADKYRGIIHPLDLYLIHAMYFVQALDGSLRTQDKIRAHLRKASDITKAADQEIQDYSKEYHKKNTS